MWRGVFPDTRRSYGVTLTKQPLVKGDYWNYSFLKNPPRDLCRVHRICTNLLCSDLQMMLPIYIVIIVHLTSLLRRSSANILRSDLALVVAAGLLRGTWGLFLREMHRRSVFQLLARGSSLASSEKERCRGRNCKERMTLSSMALVTLGPLRKATKDCQGTFNQKRGTLVWRWKVFVLLEAKIRHPPLPFKQTKPRFDRKGRRPDNNVVYIPIYVSSKQIWYFWMQNVKTIKEVKL